MPRQSQNIRLTLALLFFENHGPTRSQYVGGHSVCSLPDRCHERRICAELCVNA